MTLNVFVLGLDEANLEVLQTMPDASSLTFHQLLTREELQEGQISIPDLLTKARAQLDAFDGSIDAIMTYWDFPGTMMVPILCRERGLPSADLSAVVSLEHKYWSRLIQSRVTSDLPGFGLLDLEASEPRLPDGVNYPAWIKPVQSASSEGAYYIEGADQLAATLPTAREEVVRLGEPFEDILAMVDLPPEVEKAGGAAYLAEEAARGRQVTIEGFVFNHEAVMYGLVESVTYPGSASFLRYEYPADVPEDLHQRIAQVSRRVIEASGLNNSTFNIEFFYDSDADRLRLLEVNARHSQSHATLFHLVDGITNHHAMASLALGRRPQVPDGQGAYAAAATWHLRHFSDGVVRHVPTEEQVADFVDRHPGAKVSIDVAPGDRLSDSDFEGSYSYTLAEVITAGADTHDLQRQWDTFRSELQFVIDDDEED